MAIIGTILKNASKIANQKREKERSYLSPVELQNEQLVELLTKAEKTLFGEKYGFSKLLASENPYEAYRKEVPIFQFDFMFEKFWHKSLAGVENVSWPGKINHFALTSGTTNSSSKRIPVSEDMIRAIKSTCLDQILTLSQLDLPANFYAKSVLCVGGSTTLTKINDQYEGDLSGILAGKVPSWLNPFTKPNKKIRSIEDWEEKLEQIVDNAPKWDIGIICGVPSWINILLNRVLERYETDSIFNIWPNLRVYIHGGVSFDPYIQTFNELFEEKVIYLDTYLASEGFFGIQSAESDSLELVLNKGIFYEFIPFNQHHFDKEGNLINFEDACGLAEIENQVEYALLISTNSGAFRYLIGDTIRFTNKAKLKFKITGRTKHFLNLCGEHLSVDNMTQAITELSFEMGFSIEEFAVQGKQNLNENFVHHWYIATDAPINSLTFKYAIDEKLKELNTDYKVERNFALEEIKLDVLPTKVFYDFLKMKDKYGSQHKFPRVLKGKLADDWEKYLQILKEEVRPKWILG